MAVVLISTSLYAAESYQAFNMSGVFVLVRYSLTHAHTHTHTQNTHTRSHTHTHTHSHTHTNTGAAEDIREAAAAAR